MLWKLYHIKHLRSGLSWQKPSEHVDEITLESDLIANPAKSTKIPFVEIIHPDHVCLVDSLPAVERVGALRFF